MLEILGTIGGNVLSLPGVLGMALGMMTRNVVVAAVLGGVIGIVEVLIFGKFSFADAGALEIGVSVCVGVLAGVIGCMIRRKGATV